MKTSMMLVAAAFACVACAQGPGAMPRRGGMPPRAMDPGLDPIVRVVANPKVAEAIGLTKEQTDKIRAGEKQMRGAMKEQREKMRAAMEKQASLLQAEKVDEAAVMAAIDELFEVRKAMAKLQTKRVIEIKAMLTPEQAQKALEEMKKMRSNRRPPRPGARRPKMEPASGEGPAAEAKPVDPKPAK